MSSPYKLVIKVHSHRLNNNNNNNLLLLSLCTFLFSFFFDCILLKQTIHSSRVVLHCWWAKNNLLSPQQSNIWLSVPSGGESWRKTKVVLNIFYRVRLCRTSLVDCRKPRPGGPCIMRQKWMMDEDLPAIKFI